MELQHREGDMEPSWTFPIPQAMQQHSGSHEQKPPSAKIRETPVGPTDAAKPAASARPREALQPKGRGLI
jgi:hypothetical protein